MGHIVLSVGIVCVGALVLGQAILKLCGAHEWSWLAAPVGLSAEVLVASTAVHVPGRAVTTAVALGLLIVGAAVWLVGDRRMHPPLLDLLAPLPAAMLALVPFLANGRSGTIGVSFNNDMAAHQLLAEAYRSETVEHISGLAPLDYPLGPHALAATLAEALGTGTDTTFAALTIAAVVLLAMTALGVLRDVSPPGRVLAATLVGVPFLVAGYYGQGSFKEVLQAMLVLGTVVGLVQWSERPSRLRGVPLAIVFAGSISVYGFLGLPWLVGAVGAAVAIAGLLRLREGSLSTWVAGLRGQLVPLAIAVGVLAVVLVPQAERLGHFLSRAGKANGTGIASDDLGNLAGRLPIWEAFGIWDNPDYRLPASDGFSTDAWTAFVVILVGFGVVWAVRRRQWLLPVSTAVAFAIWVVSDRTQSPYVAAKALVILSPLLLLVAVRPLVRFELPRGGGWRKALAFVGPVLALVLVVKVVGSSWDALRISRIGPRAHTAELHSLRPMLHGRRTLYLGNSDFALWELAGVRADAPVVGFQRLPFSPDKPWTYGQALDFDSVDARTLNTFDWVISTRDGAASQPPPQMQLVRQTRSFDLWRRRGTVQPRRTLAEGDGGGAVLDCTTPAGRRIARGGGIASIRPAPIGVAVPQIQPNQSVGVELDLPPGTYDLSTPYLSERPLSVTVVGALQTHLPANLDRPGPRYRIGRIQVRSRRRTTVGFYASKERLTPKTAMVLPTSVVAQPVGGRRTVPVRQACGELVDWYRPEA